MLTSMHCRDPEYLITQTMTSIQLAKLRLNRETCMLSGDIHKDSTYYLLKGTRRKTIYSLQNCQLIIFGGA